MQKESQKKSLAFSNYQKVIPNANMVVNPMMFAMRGAMQMGYV